MAQQGKALVIGASRGIGLAVVQAFAAQGWQVTATHRSGIPAQGEQPGAGYDRIVGSAAAGRPARRTDV